MTDETWLRDVLSGVREPCEEDDGSPRRCCGTRQLGPHADRCPKSPPVQEAILDHERMYSHESEVSE